MKPDITIMRRKQLVGLDPQRCFNARQKAAIFERADGRCEVPGCGEKIRGRWIAGHYPIPHALGGRTIVSNGRVECMVCAKGTHADDTTTAAKTERIAGRKGQAFRRDKNGPKLRSPKRSWPKRKFQRKDER